LHVDILDEVFSLETTGNADLRTSLEAGAAFVLLNMDHPLKRLKSICQSVDAEIIVCSRQNTLQAANLAPTVVPVYDNAKCFHGNSINLTPPSVSPDNALYGVFTSGTTGTPKGIIVEHASFCSSAEGQSEAFHLGPKSRVLQFASHSFDASIADYLTTLIHGGCVCIPKEFDRNNRLAQATLEMKANWVFLTPSLARILSPSDFPTLKIM
jgi:non-ribosomal peptide synthetase component F